MHYKDKNLQIDIRCHTVFMNDQKIELSLKEFTVLNLLRKVNNYFYLFYFLSQNIFAYHK